MPRGTCARMWLIRLGGIARETCEAWLRGCLGQRSLALGLVSIIVLASLRLPGGSPAAAGVSLVRFLPHLPQPVWGWALPVAGFREGARCFWVCDALAEIAGAEAYGGVHGGVGLDNEDLPDS